MPAISIAISTLQTTGDTTPGGITDVLLWDDTFGLLTGDGGYLKLS